MKTIQELIDLRTNEETDEVDLAAVTEDIMEALADVPPLPPQAVIAIEAQVSEKMFDYLGDLFLRLAAEIGALPRGLDEEQQNLAVFKTFARASSVYSLVQQMKEMQAGLVVAKTEGLVIPK